MEILPSSSFMVGSVGRVTLLLVVTFAAALIYNVHLFIPIYPCQDLLHGVDD